MAPAASTRRRKDDDGAAPETTQRVFHFGKGRSDGNKAMKDLLGGKGANLAEMASIGLSVPPGFTVSTEACRQYQLQELGGGGGGRRRAMPAGLWDEVVAALRLLERAMDSGLGDPRRPLLLSVRSGAAVSMPGMMDTVLNLGLNDQVVAGLAQRCGCRFAYDSYRRFLDMFGNVDIEFTVQENRLWMLQCRTGKRTGKGAVKIAVDMVNEGLIDHHSAIKMVEPRHLDQLLHPQFEDTLSYEDKVIATGLPASPGAAVGQIVFTAVDAETWHSQGKSVVLVRTETSPEDVGGMHAAAGILTARGGMTSHAAVVARGWGKCCVAGCSSIHVNDAEKVVVVGDQVLCEGDWLSLNGSTGDVILGKLPLSPPSLSADLEIFLSWVDEVKQIKVMVNADTPADALTGRKNGAQGIGLCRTEHMFFSSDERIKAMRQMIMADTAEQRQKALDLLLPYQRVDFEGIFRAMDGLPVTIRLLDPPLHEFLPEGNIEDIVHMLSCHTDSTHEEILARIEKISEVNPMLGFRGCRLGISYPELTAMQARAIFEAAIAVNDQGFQVFPEIMVPLVGTPQELEQQMSVIHQVAHKVFANSEATIRYKIGSMIEVPRAALIADEIAELAEFFSFGTNDLTQMTFGYSRDDVSKFLPTYISQGILQHDPFEVFDQKGVGELVKIATARGRRSRPDLEVGICGEHGGEPSSVAFFAKAGLDYVSCSPFRVPIARLAAAQAALE